MNPVPVPEVAKEWYPTLRTINVGKPGYTGSNDGDGSSVREAATLQAMFGQDMSEYGAPHFREFWKLEETDWEVIGERGGLIMLTFWIPQMPVHALQVVATK